MGKPIFVETIVNPTLDELAKKKIVAMVKFPFMSAIVARYNVNKTTLKKLAKQVQKRRS